MQPDHVTGLWARAALDPSNDSTLGALMARTSSPAAASGPHRTTAVSRTPMALTVLALGLLILLAAIR
jgi:hypothetical protein